MNPRRRPVHRLVLLLAAVAVLPLLVSLLGGCAPPAHSPMPTPTPTPAFASEAEAFAAAEDVYRAYNEAGNTRVDDERFLTGRALSSDLEVKRLLDENGLEIVGASDVVSFKGVDADLQNSVAWVKTEICLDISSSRLKDSEGTDVTPNDRANRWVLEVTFAGDSTELLITDSSPVEGATC